MGTGKSAVGQRVAGSLGFTFVDTDQLIEQQAGKKISQIFADESEDEFRRLETETFRSVAQAENQVISTGGGIVLAPENRELLATAGYVLWLKASPEAIYERVRHNRDRPLLQVDNPLQTIKDLTEERNPLYRECAHNKVNTSDLTLDETAHGVTETLFYAISSGTPS